eukprot:7518806-Pyramimonas_sp.AAC.1
MIQGVQYIKGVHGFPVKGGIYRRYLGLHARACGLGPQQEGRARTVANMQGRIRRQSHGIVASLGLLAVGGSWHVRRRGGAKSQRDGARRRGGSGHTCGPAKPDGRPKIEAQAKTVE